MTAFEFDPVKNAANREKHGRGLDEFTRFDDLPIVVLDERQDYGEQRFRAFGRIDGVAHMVAFVRRGSKFRLVSFRRAHEKELRRHERA